MGKKIVISLTVVMLTGALLSHPAFAHNFVQNSNSDLIAKIQEFKTESSLVANNISNSTLSQWHISKSQDYFGSNEIMVLSQKNSTLADNLSAYIDNFYSLAGQSNADPTVVTQKATTLNQMMDQVESVEISSTDQNNATIQSLAIVGILKEVLNDYGSAIGSNAVDLNNMSSMNMSSMSMDNSSSMGSGSMSGMQSGNNMQRMSGISSTAVVNVAAYQSAQALTDTAQTMSNNLKSIAPSNSSPYLDEIGNALMDLKHAINSKESANDVMMIVHLQIHPDFISGFNLRVVPEFPMPILLVIVSFIVAVVMSRVVFVRNSVREEKK